MSKCFVCGEDLEVSEEKCGVEKRKPVIDSIDLLAAEIGKVEQDVGSLFKNLDYVLAPSNPDPGENKAGEDAIQSPMVAVVKQLTGRLALVRRNLNELRGRLEI